MANDPFQSAYAFEKRFRLPRLHLTIEKAEAAYKTLEPETIDWCKSIIESMCKQMLREKDSAFADDEKTELPKLIKAAMDRAGIDNDQIRGGISSLANAIVQIRNDQTVAGHGLMGKKPLIGKTEIQLFISTFEHLTRIFLILLQREEPDIHHTTMAFNELETLLELEDFNRQMDASVSVDRDQEEGVLFIGGKEIRPSEILYSFDRKTYVEKIHAAQQDAAEDLHEQAISKIDTYLCEEGVFDGFSPGHYGYDLDEIYIDSIKLNRLGGTAAVTGSIYATVRLRSSSDEDGCDINYSSNFTADFIMYSDKEGSTTELKLESLDLEKTDWIDERDPDD